MEGTKEIKLIYLEAINNLCKLEDTLPELCRHGLMTILSEYFNHSNQKEIVRAAA